MANAKEGPGPAPDAIEFAYEVASVKLASQLDTIDKLDTKLGVVIAALATLASLYTASTRGSLAGLLLLVPAATAAIGYSSRNWANPPNPARLAEYANLGKQEMQEQALAAILQAFPVNDAELSKKAGWFNASLVITIFAVLGLIVLSLVFPKAS